VPGSTVWISMFSWDADRVDVQSDSIAAAKDAHARGVNVRVLLYHKRFHTEAIRSLAATLGTDTTQRSWAKVCVGACLGGSGASAGVHHAKLLVFSKIATAGGRFITDLTYVSSANLTGSNSVDSWNNTTVIPNDPTIAKAATGYMADMVKDTRDLNTGPIGSGVYRIDFYPRKSLAPDPALAVLKKVNCTVKEAGYGREGRTVVRLLMYGWKVGRLAVAKKLVALRKAGCNVAVIVNNDPAQHSLSAKVAAKLIKGKVPTWDGRWVEDRVSTRYNHAKTLVINGSYDGKPTKRVYSGSSNLTVGSVTSNDEVTLRTIDAATTTQTEAWFTQVKAHSKQLTKVPSTTSTAETDDGELAGP
jgi:PLD-like domain